MTGEAYETLVARFRWEIPERFNIAAACVDRWAERHPERPALIGVDALGRARATSFGELRRGSDALAAALRRRGIKRGDRVAILLPQSAETVVAHMAVYKLAAIAVPLAALFGADALRYRLANSGAKAIVTDQAGIDKLAPIRAMLPDLATVLSVDGPSGDAEDFAKAVSEGGEAFVPEATAPDDPALMIYTSGTTGLPKGTLHGHRVLPGHLPGMAFTHHGFPGEGERLWTPSDWAWAGGLLNALLPSLYCGVPVIFGPFRPFDADAAFALMAEACVTRAFLPPTALKMMRNADAPSERRELSLRSIGSAGESLGREIYEWALSGLGLPADEFYGQTECNYVLGSSFAGGVSRPGAIGMPIPGHTVAVLDNDGHETSVDVPGEIAIRRPDPSMFLGYWNEPEATAAKFLGEWMLTGDQAIRDRDGYVQFVGRKDDIITSAGYRIGPGEVEDCLLAHPAVAFAAAVGKPDPLRTEIVKAYVVLRSGLMPSAMLASELRLFVRSRLSAAEYPREIEFVDALPLTSSGKVIRRELRERAKRELAGGPS